LNSSIRMIVCLLDLKLAAYEAEAKKMPGKTKSRKQRLIDCFNCTKPFRLKRSILHDRKELRQKGTRQ